MFTGITQGLATIKHIEHLPGLLNYQLTLPDNLCHNLTLGASVAVNGVCQSITHIESSNTIHLQAIQETLDKTTLNNLSLGDKVHIERSAKIGDEIGGHMLSGHIHGTATLQSIDEDANNLKLYFTCPTKWMPFILNKGFIAINGCSLTIADSLPEGLFSVYLIPETRRATCFDGLQEGDAVNIELDQQTVTIVMTVERILRQR